MPAKGGDFERNLCKLLSSWWTHGKSDDVLWRTSQSGGRATVRARKGHRTSNHCGDIAATDPIAFPLTHTFTIECKRGYNKADPIHILDRSVAPKKRNVQTPFEAFLEQAIDAQVRAGTPFWAIIHKRDMWDAMIYFDSKAYSALLEVGCPIISSMCSFSVYAILHRKRKRVCFVGCSLRKFLKIVRPENIIRLHKEKEIWKQF